jgi:hypothetical protein
MSIKPCQRRSIDLPGGWYDRGLIVHQQLHRPSDRNNNIDVKLIAYLGYVFGKLGLDKYCSVVVAVNVCVAVQPVPAENNKTE